MAGGGDFEEFGDAFVGHGLVFDAGEEDDTFRWEITI